jgi:hypothetical protein
LAVGGQHREKCGCSVSDSGDRVDG